MSIRIKNILKDYVKGISEILQEKLVQVILYGSYARGDQNQNGEVSDIDILILVNENQENIKKMEKEIIDYSYDWNLKYNILLSPVIENIDEYNKKINYITFYKNIQKEGVLLSK